MPYNTVSFTSAVTQFGDGTAAIRVPEGDYLLTLADVRPSPEESEKDPAVTFRFRITEGPLRGEPAGIGRYISVYVPMTEKMLWKLGQTLAGMGADPAQLVGKSLPTYAHFKGFVDSLAKALTGKTCGAEIGDYNHNGRAMSQVNACYVVAEFEQRKATAASLPMTVSAPAPEPAPALVGAVPTPATSVGTIIQEEFVL